MLSWEQLWLERFKVLFKLMTFLGGELVPLISRGFSGVLVVFLLTLNIFNSDKADFVLRFRVKDLSLDFKLSRFFT